MTDKPIYRITYVSGTHNNSWLNMNECHKIQPPVNTSIGFVVHEDDKKIVLAMTISDSDQVCLFSGIHKSTIIKKQKLIVVPADFGESIVRWQDITNNEENN